MQDIFHNAKAQALVCLPVGKFNVMWAIYPLQSRVTQFSMQNHPRPVDFYREKTPNVRNMRIPLPNFTLRKQLRLPLI